MNQYLFKIVLIGDGAVGKTSIRRRYMGEGFRSDFLATMGADFAYLKTEVDDDFVDWQIWDLAGQPAFRNVMKAYFKGSMGCLAIYDVTQPRSLDSLDSWIEEARLHSQSSTEIPAVIVGNKTDLRDEVPNSIKTIDGFVKSKALKADFIETSAKTGINVEDAFIVIGEEILKGIEHRE